jgi:signal transduction histidine kinase
MRRRFGTIVSRIFWLHLVAIGAAALAMTAGIYLLLNAALAGFERHALSEHAAAIADALRADPAGARMALSPQLREMYAEGYGGYAFAVVGSDGKALFSSVPGGGALFAADPRRGGPSYFQRPRGPNAFFGASYAERVGGRPVWIQVRQSLENPDVFVDDVVFQFLHQIGWLIAATVALLLAADIFIVQRALAPVREASERAEAIDPARIDVRLPTEALPSEVEPLVVAMNRALDRLEAGFRAQREFTADAAHELRTPLAILRLRADTLADQDAARMIRADVERMGRLVDQLLVITEMETFALSSTDKVDLREIGLEVSSFMAPLAIAAAKYLELDVGEAPVWIRGQGEALVRALRNLVENAIAHTPAGGAVVIAVDADGSVAVSDQGVGVAEHERELIFQRFWRRDRQSAKGSGLGLSIVQRIVAAHGGSITVDSTPSGGARFLLRFQRV